MANYTCKNVTIKPLQGVENEFYAEWTFEAIKVSGYDRRAGYDYQWAYCVGGRWFLAETGTTSVSSMDKPRITPPANATMLGFKVRPASQQYTNAYNQQVYFFSSSWAAAKDYNLSGLSPKIPSEPNIEFDYTNKSITISNTVELVEGGPNNATKIEYQILNLTDSTSSKNVYATLTGTVSKTTGRAAVEYQLTAGKSYRVRCRAIDAQNNASSYTDYSPASPNIILALPNTTEINDISTVSYTLTNRTLQFKWDDCSERIDSYILEYAESEIELYSGNASQVTYEPHQNKTITIDRQISKLYCRVRATNSTGNGEWSKIKDITLGMAPAAPTTWTLRSTYALGDKIIFYWIHNSKDNSHQEKAELELTINGKTQVIVVNNPEDPDLRDRTSSYTLDTQLYPSDMDITWRVRTKGVFNDNESGGFGDWSITRTVNVYTKPTVDIHISEQIRNIEGKREWYWDPFNFTTDSIFTAPAVLGSDTNIISHFPFFISATGYPNTQKVIRCYFTIKSTQTYTIMNDDGTEQTVRPNEIIYSSYKNAERSVNYFFLTITPGLINLENNIHYICEVSMTFDSGLTATNQFEFDTDWEEDEFSVDAEVNTFESPIEIDYENGVTASLVPFAYITTETEEGVELTRYDDVWLSVYRRNYDGKLILIAKDIDAALSTTVIDPHPALDFARYRIVGQSKNTGSMSYYDLPIIPVNEDAIIIQWDEEWTTYDGRDTDYSGRIIDRGWNGSLLRLPYNVDVSDEYEPDVALVSYIGRQSPVSYYGTQISEKPTWNVEIPKSDTETIYQLRRLAKYMGDCYIREPSGTGYWANVVVSFSQTHCELTIPVSIKITRVEGGM